MTSVVGSLFYTWYTYNRHLRDLDLKKNFMTKKYSKGAVAHGDYFFRSFPKKFEFVSLCSFICLQAVYQLSGPVYKATWSGCPSYSWITTVEYGQIFHVTHIGKYYCKIMKYKINIFIRTPTPITLPCSLVRAGNYTFYIKIFHEQWNTHKLYLPFISTSASEFPPYKRLLCENF